MTPPGGTVPAGRRRRSAIGLVGALLVSHLALLASAATVPRPDGHDGLEGVLRWAAATPADDLAVAGLWVAGAVLTCWLSAVALVAVVARAGRWRPAATVARALTPSRLRPLVGLGATVGAIGAVTAPTMALPIATAIPADVSAPTTAPPAPTMTVATTEPPVLEVVADEPGRPSPSDAGAGPGGIDGEVTIPPTTPPTGLPDPAAPPPSPTWTIRPGEHLWHVAEATVGADGSRAGLARVAGYHRLLIAANADRFVIPGDPDLVLPGQELVLPPVP